MRLYGGSLVARRKGLMKEAAQEFGEAHANPGACLFFEECRARYNHATLMGIRAQTLDPEYSQVLKSKEV